MLDVGGVEQVNCLARGGIDALTIADLTGTGVTGLFVDLANPSGTNTGDAQNDLVTISGTAGNDVVYITGASGLVNILGLAAAIALSGCEPNGDQLRINLLAGDDYADASGLAATSVQLILDGGPDNDTLIGSDGPDALFGGDGDDQLFGGPGLDFLDGGPGNNVVIQ